MLEDSKRLVSHCGLFPPLYSTGSRSACVRVALVCLCVHVCMCACVCGGGGCLVRSRHRCRHSLCCQPIHSTYAGVRTGEPCGVLVLPRFCLRGGCCHQCRGSCRHACNLGRHYSHAHNADGQGDCIRGGARAWLIAALVLVRVRVLLFLFHANPHAHGNLTPFPLQVRSNPSPNLQQQRVEG